MLELYAALRSRLSGAPSQAWVRDEGFAPTPRCLHCGCPYFDGSATKQTCESCAQPRGVVHATIMPGEVQENQRPGTNDWALSTCLKIERLLDTVERWRMRSLWCYVVVCGASSYADAQRVMARAWPTKCRQWSPEYVQHLARACRDDIARALESQPHINLNLSA